MKRNGLLLLSTLLIGLVPVLAQTAAKKTESLFYMVDSPESFESFQKNVADIDIVCPQTFLVSKEGVLTGDVDRRILRLAKENNIKVVPLIVNKGFDGQLLHDIVSNPIAR